jgi:purine-nucleoside phosphorylase
MSAAGTGDGTAAAAHVRARSDLRFAFGIVLGSGLGGLADEVEDAVAFPYAEIPEFPVSTVSAHAGRLVIGRLAGVPVIVMSGRSHYYEAGNAAAMRPAIGMLKHLGCHSLFLTNAAGSLREEVPPATLMTITDHINLAGANPLIGEPTDARFVSLTTAYDPEYRFALQMAARYERVPLAEGVYAWFSGPSFETPAEIRAARTLGANAVGMSTVPEVILARFFGLRVAAVSIITNYAAGMTGAELSHEETKEIAPRGAVFLTRLIHRFLADQS